MVKSPTSFLRMIDSSEKEYQKIKHNLDRFYTKQERQKTDQFGNIKFDQDGNPEKRIIHPSWKKLKSIQKLINSRILSQIPLPDALHGAIKEKSCITNAKAHQGNKYFLLTDLRGFFPSIKHYIVHERLLEAGFSKPVAHMITRLVTYKGCVPQGAPTSSTIANFVFFPYDQKLMKICSNKNLTYTRFVDDLTFSSKTFISQNTVDSLLDVIRSSPFKFHPRKTGMSIGRTEVTGVEVRNNGLEAPLRKYFKLYLLDQDTLSAKGLSGHINAIRNA